MVSPELRVPLPRRRLFVTSMSSGSCESFRTFVGKPPRCDDELGGDGPSRMTEPRRRLGLRQTAATISRDRGHDFDRNRLESSHALNSNVVSDQPDEAIQTGLLHHHRKSMNIKELRIRTWVNASDCPASHSRPSECDSSWFAHFDSDKMIRHHRDVEKDLRYGLLEPEPTRFRRSSACFGS